MTTLHIDLETRSVVDLRKTGVYVYAADPSTDVWCAALAVDDHPVELWYPGCDVRGVPEAVTAAYQADWTIVAHNANFERAIWAGVLGPKYGWPIPQLEQWRCTMAMALAMSLPASLENCAAALGLGVAKDMDGHNVMMRMAKPRRPRKGENPDGIFWFDDEERKQKLYDYCKNDVVVERAIEKKLLALRPFEQRLWHLDQEINDRGVYVDVELCNAAKRVVAHATKWLNEELQALTSGVATSVTNVGDITTWLSRQGVEMPSLDKEHVAAALNRRDLSSDVRRVLEIRQEGSKASVKKIDALLGGRSADGRARGLYQFCAASTRRWGGRRWQPQNLKTPDEDRDIDGAIETVLTGSAELVRMVEGNPIEVVGDLSRSMARAAPGHEFYAADFTSIEGVVLPWLAGEEWKLDAFREYIAGRAPDLYIQGYCKAFGVPVFGKRDPRRKFGKVMELASGFQGGIGAYLRMGATGETLALLTRIVRESVEDYEWEAAEEKYNGSHDLTIDEWTALRVTIDRWRGGHPRIKQFWWDLEDAAATAMRNRGEVIPCGRIAFRAAGTFLYMRLPGGGSLCYPYPRLAEVRTPWGATKQTVVYKGVDSYTRKWQDCYAYGGLWAENATQATARDVQAEAMVRLEDAGYPIVLHTHDEIVAEVEIGFGSVSEYVKIMSEIPAWADGLPIAAAGWAGPRYKKD